MNEKFQHIEIPDEDKPENPGRRKFLKDAVKVAVATGAVASAPKIFEHIKEEETEEMSPETRELAEKIQKEHAESERERLAEEIRKEHEETEITPLQQIAEFGEIRDMGAGVDAIYDKHYKYHTATSKGKRDMEVAVENLSKLDLKKIADPFLEKGFPKNLAYMIAIQETRARNMRSWAGARGMTGIMPATAKALGYKTRDADNPYIASKITAQYLEEERKRFGDDVDLILHAYNAGGGLFGFTKEHPKEERTKEKFYAYMEKYLNNILTEVKEKGYYLHSIDSKDRTLTGISKRFKVPLYKILKANDFTKETIIHKGDTVKIPYDDLKHAAKVLLRKPLEAIRYTPQIKAKHDALREHGFTEKIELAMS